MSTLSRRHLALVAAVIAALVLAVAPPPVEATPGLAYGNYAWYNPGTTATNGLLKTYVGYASYSSVTAGSGNGPNWNNPCISNVGRLPNGWYSTHNDKHVNNKNDTIKGRVWGISDKNCGNGTIRSELFIHTEETSTNGQTCTAAPDDPYCWEGTFDYESQGCVKVSHPSGISTVHSWWHNAVVAGGHGISYTNILWVGDGSPPI